MSQVTLPLSDCKLLGLDRARAGMMELDGDDGAGMGMMGGGDGARSGDDDT